MQAFSKYNNWVKYLLTVIDVFSKYGWMKPLKSKAGLEVANALKKIFKERKPDKLRVDKGREFYNKEVYTETYNLVFHRERGEIERSRKMELEREGKDVLSIFLRIPPGNTSIF